jgi:hypothetical protein
MPHKLNIDDKARAQRHVLGQQLYRLRKRYRFLVDQGLLLGAGNLGAVIRRKESEWDALGGKPYHPGNVL